MASSHAIATTGVCFCRSTAAAEGIASRRYAVRKRYMIRVGFWFVAYSVPKKYLEIKKLLFIFV